MTREPKSDNSFMTLSIILISILAIVYFLFQAMQDKSKRGRPNPYEYNLESFKKTDSIKPSFTEGDSIPFECETAYAIAIDENDRLFISTDQRIQVFSSQGKPLFTFEVPKPVYCLRSDGHGSLFLGMAKQIMKVDENGKQLAVWSSLGDKAILTSLAVTSEFVFAADAGNLVVWKYDRNGQIVDQIGRKDETRDLPGYLIPSPYFDVDIDPEGFLWAANTGRHSLENYTPDGGLRTSWGKPGMSLDRFSGCCNPSHFIIMKDGSFVTAEKGLPRVKIYNRLGSLTALVAGPESFHESNKDMDLALDSHEQIYVLDTFKKTVRVFARKGGD